MVSEEDIVSARWRRLAAAHPGSANMLGGVGKESKVAGALNGIRERSLVLGAGAGFAPRLNSATFGDEPAEEAHVLVVDELNVVGAHYADAAATATSALGALIAAWAVSRSSARGVRRRPFASAERRGRLRGSLGRSFVACPDIFHTCPTRKECPLAPHRLRPRGRRRGVRREAVRPRGRGRARARR